MYCLFLYQNSMYELPMLVRRWRKNVCCIQFLAKTFQFFLKFSAKKFLNKKTKTFLHQRNLAQSACLNVMHVIKVEKHKTQRVEQLVLIQVSTPNEFFPLSHCRRLLKTRFTQNLRLCQVSLSGCKNNGTKIWAA